MDERLCKYAMGEICCNAFCPACADFCPVMRQPGLCMYEDRSAEGETEDA